MRQAIIEFKNKVGVFLMGIPMDKYLHFIAGMLVVLVFNSILGENYGNKPLLGFAVASLITAGVGVLKEVFDHFFGGTVDPKDALATYLGGLVTAIFIFLI